MNGPSNGLSGWARVFRDVGFPAGVAGILLYYVLAKAPGREDIAAVKGAISEGMAGIQEVQRRVVDNQTKIILMLDEIRTRK